MDLDFTKARLQHQFPAPTWRRYLRANEEINRDEAVSPRECALGKWLYSDGLHKYGDRPEMRNLESVHAPMHAVFERVVRLKRSGSDAEAGTEYQKVSPLSRKIVWLLDRLEKHVNSQSPAPEFAHPPRGR
jgi:methyl-accepting chemotaxis protein